MIEINDYNNNPIEKKYIDIIIKYLYVGKMSNNKFTDLLSIMKMYILADFLEIIKIKGNYLNNINKYFGDIFAKNIQNILNDTKLLNHLIKINKIKNVGDGNGECSDWLLGDKYITEYQPIRCYFEKINFTDKYILQEKYKRLLSDNMKLFKKKLEEIGIYDDILVCIQKSDFNINIKCCILTLLNNPDNDITGSNSRQLYKLLYNSLNILRHIIGSQFSNWYINILYKSTDDNRLHLTDNKKALKFMTLYLKKQKCITQNEYEIIRYILPKYDDFLKQLVCDE